VRNGLTSAYWYPVAATCPGVAAHYGVLGTTFCPAGLWPP
jgi:hypothetical protein